MDTLHDVLLPELMDHHAKRVTQMVSGIYIRVGVTVLVALLAIALAYVITRLTARPLREAIRVFDNVAAGKLDNEIDISRRDEIGEVLCEAELHAGEAARAARKRARRRIGQRAPEAGAR